MSKTKNTHGGARTGSGRKPSKDGRIPVSVRLPASLVKEIDARGSRTEVIHSAVLTYLVTEHIGITMPIADDK